MITIHAVNKNGSDAVTKSFTTESIFSELNDWIQSIPYSKYYFDSDIDETLNDDVIDLLDKHEIPV